MTIAGSHTRIAVKRWLIRAFRFTVLSVVAWFIWWSIADARRELADQQFSLRQVNPTWVMVAGACYALGMLPMGWYWNRILHALGQHTSMMASLRAFYVGHLGKYVPGKAMVVVLRTSLIRGEGVDATIAALSVFVETLTMMAVGAFLAGAILAIQWGGDSSFQWLAWGLVCATGVPILPPVFRRIVALLQVAKFNKTVTSSLEGLTFRLMFTGWLACALGWCLLGVSLWATLKAVPLEPEVASFWQAAPRLTASVALAVVAGFLSLIPGGLGVRDVIIDQLIAVEFGAAKAIIATVLLRLAWLVTEVLLSVILYIGARRPPKD